jgi:predicted branched-subunit amino acid permease
VVPDLTADTLGPASRVPSFASTVAAALPAIVAIGVFGALYGAVARPLLGAELTIFASFVIFSGSLQFALVGLLAAGAAAPALLLTAVILNLRHVVLGAVLRGSLGPSRIRRVIQSWFLLDETFGFAVAAASAPRLSPAERTAVTERTLVGVGIFCYSAWIGGTILGVVGAGVPELAGVAGAVFPVLFIGLAALTARSRSVVVRAVAAAVITATIALAFPDARALAPVVAGVLVSLPGDRQ